MVFKKQLCLLCSKAVARRFCGKNSNVSAGIAREFSSQDSDNRNKKPKKLVVVAKNDFVTHHLNTSISMHLQRQQKIANQVQAEERQSKQNRYKSNYSDDSFHKNNHRHSSVKTAPFRQYDSYNKQNNQTKKYDKKYSYNKSHTTNYENKFNKKHDSRREELTESDSDDFELEELPTPNWNDMDLIRINKTFYKPSDVTKSRSLDDIDAFYMKMHIQCWDTMPKPIFKFNELSELPNEIIAEIEKQCVTECTAAQAQGLPMAISGANMICVAQSGTGKTLSMVLSAIIHISHQTPTNPIDGPVAIILAPTPEMAEEIQLLANEFCTKANIKSSLLCSDLEQFKSYKSTEVYDLLIATPDALYEMLRSKSLTLYRCSYLTLYEADKMIDLGLDEEITQIASQIRPDCQRTVWSTVWNSELKLLAAELLDDYCRLNIGSSAIKANSCRNIEQIVKVSEEEKKENELDEIIEAIESRTENNRKTLVFTETQEKADKVADILKKKGCKSESFHNRKSIIQRDAILTRFHNDEFQYLVLTDVAAKNVNFNRTSNVINFDMPVSIVDYVNRVCRTGRMNDGIGTSYSIVTEDDGYLVDDLIATLRESGQKIDPALFILKAANADSDDEISFAIPKGKVYQKYTIDRTKK